MFCSLVFQTVFAQLDTIHWIPPLHCRDVGQIQDHYLYLSTPVKTPFKVTITDGSGKVLATPTISNASPYRYTIGSGQTSGSPSFIPVSSLNKVLTGKGLILSAPKEFFANLRARASVQAECLTAKGRAALGTTFRVGGFPQLQESRYRNFTAGIMATENGTTVTISDYNPGIVFAGVPTVSSSPSLTIKLNKGQCYVVSGYTNIAANRSGFVGALVKSNNPIVLNNGNLLGTVANNTSSQDMGMDQSVPIERIGKDYILIEGNGVSEMERPIVIAHYDNTKIFINGSTNPVATLNAGGFYLVPNSYYQGTTHKNMYIHTSEPAYMYQALAGADRLTTPGLNFIPPYSCYLPTSIDLISSVNQIGNTTYTGGVMIFTKQGATLKINGVIQKGAVPVKSIPWETYKIKGLTGNVSITSTAGVAAAIFGASGDAGFAGYFAGFSLDVSPATFTYSNPCSSSMTAFKASYKDYVDSIAWDFGDVASGVNNTSTTQNATHVYTSPGKYTVQLVTYINICKEITTQEITIYPIPSAGFSVQSHCAEHTLSFSDQSTVSGGTINSWRWDFGEGATASLKDTSHQYSVAGTYDVQHIVTSNNACSDTITKQVYVVSSTNLFTVKNTCKGDSISIGIPPFPGCKYNWQPSAGLSFSNNADPMAAPSTSTTYTLIVTDMYGCNSKDSIEIKLYPLPYADAGTDKDICIGDSVMLEGKGGLIYLWKPSGGFSNPTSPSLYVRPSETSSYTLIVTDSNACRDSAVVKINVNTFPVSGFKVNYTASCDGMIGNFTNTSSGADAYLWDFGDGITSKDEQPEHLFPYGGSYTIKQIAINNAICRDTSVLAYTTASMNDNIVAVYPNVFTPNNDGINDLFSFNLEGNFQGCFSLVIFNRWGGKVFDKAISYWDGKTTGGKQADEGVYFYVFKIKDNIVAKGYITLLY